MIRFRVLGPLRVERQGSHPIPLNALMVRRLLAALLVNANQLVSTDQLVSCLWGESEPPTARKTLQVYVRRLRAALVDESRIIFESAGYRIRVAEDELDYLRFTRLTATAAREGRTERAVQLLREALDLWRGQAYEDVREHPPLADEARRLDEERLRIEAEHASLQLDLGRHTELVPHLSKLVKEHPYREDLRGHLMLSLYRSGRQSEALELFRGTRKMLAEDLGVEPGPQLRRLHEAILRASPELDLPPARKSPAPRELPATGGFVGRSQQMRSLDDMLTGAAPVVISAIAGTAGVGKTALAVHWARTVIDRFPDGQLYLNLNGFSSSPPMQPIEALAAMLRSIGVPAEKVPVDEAEAASMFRSQMAGRRMLVLLDNARSADQIRPLLPGDPASLVLITSRNSLSGLVAREGARRLNLDVLTPDEAQALLAAALGRDRVAAEPEATASLAQVCAYLPLALRVAAANLNDRPHRTIATHVASLLGGNRLGSLAVEGDEQTAVKAAFDLSYLDLPDDIRRTFRLLGLIPGPDFTVPAVAALTGQSPQQAEHHLARLADAHLIDQTTADRYTFHDLLRLYASSRTTTDDTLEGRATATRHLFDWYVHSVDAAATLLYPNVIRLPLPEASTANFVAVSEALTWLDLERHNLLAAIHAAAQGSGQESAAWFLAGGLRGYFSRRRHLNEFLTAAEVALHAASKSANPSAHGHAHLVLAHAHQINSDYTAAAHHLRAANQLAQEASWHELAAACLGNLGGVLYETGTMDESADYVCQSLEASRKVGHRSGRARSLSNLGFLYLRAGRLSDSVAVLREATELSRSIGLAQIEATSLTELGETYRLLGRLKQATSVLERALRIRREIGDRFGESETLVAVSKVFEDRMRFEDAAGHAQAALAAAKEVGSVAAEIEAHLRMAFLQVATGDAAGGLAGFAQTAGMLGDLVGFRYSRVLAAVGLAKTHLTLDDLDGSSLPAMRALEISREAGFRILEGQALTVLAWSDARQGRKSALDHAQNALEINKSTGYQLGEAETLTLLAELEPENASNHVRRAKGIYASLRDGDRDAIAGMV